MGRDAGMGEDGGKVARRVLFAEGVGLSEPGYNGGRWRGGVSAGGAIKDWAFYLRPLSASCL